MTTINELIRSLERPIDEDAKGERFYLYMLKTIKTTTAKNIHNINRKLIKLASGRRQS